MNSFSVTQLKDILNILNYVEGELAEGNPTFCEEFCPFDARSCKDCIIQNLQRKIEKRLDNLQDN